MHTIDVLFAVHLLGHFSWLFTLMKYAFARSEAGKAALYVRNVALDLVKVRRETKNAEKV